MFRPYGKWDKSWWGGKYFGRVVIIIIKTSHDFPQKPYFRGV